jgi:hypothetical protein
VGDGSAPKCLVHKVGRSKDEVVGRNLCVKDGGMLPMDENLIDHLDINLNDQPRRNGQLPGSPGSWYLCVFVILQNKAVHDIYVDVTKQSCNM